MNAVESMHAVGKWLLNRILQPVVKSPAIANFAHAAFESD